MLRERKAEPGELCTCGRQAVTVFDAGSGEVGSCGQPDGLSRPVTPCLWCGSETAHLEPHGSPGTCPDYTLRVDW